MNPNRKGEPFFFWYGAHEPHRAYEFMAGVNKGGKHLSDVDRVFEFWPDNDTVRHYILDYAFEIEYFDLHLERMIRILEEKGMLENTIVVVTSDNGMPFPRIKGQAYKLSNHLPLAVMWPNLVNYQPERWPKGNPETGYMNCDGSPVKSWILNDRRAKGESWFWQMNFGKRPSEEFYKISSDPECLVNLADDTAYSDTRRELADKMTGELKKQQDPRVLGNGSIFENYEYARNIRNFYNRFMAGEDLKAGWINQTDIEQEKLD